MPLTKEEAIENVKTAKRELKHLLNEHGCAMNGWGKAESYNVIRQLLLRLTIDEINELGIFKEANEERDGITKLDAHPYR